MSGCPQWECPSTSTDLRKRVANWLPSVVPVWIGNPSRGEQAKVTARVRELVGERPGDGGSHRRPDDDQFTRRRWEPSRSVLVAVACLVVLVVAITIWWYLTSQSPAVPVAATGAEATFGSSSPSDSTPAPAIGPSSSPSPTEIVVDVAGK